MIKQAVRIETFMIKKGELTLHKENKQGSSSSSKDKSKFPNKNHNVVNDGVVDNVTAKPSKATFNLTTTMQAAKATEQAAAASKPSTSRFSGPKPWAPRPKREFTPLGEPLEAVYKTLVDKNLLTPLANP